MATVAQIDEALKLLRSLRHARALAAEERDDAARFGVVSAAMLKEANAKLEKAIAAEESGRAALRELLAEREQ